MLCASQATVTVLQRAEKGMAMRRLLVVWAVLDGAVWQSWPLLAATGGSTTAEDADIEKTYRH